MCCHFVFIVRVSLTADVSGSNKPSAADEHKPVNEVHPEAKGNVDDPADEELTSTSAVLENIPESVNQEFIEMLVENVIKDLSSTTASNFSLEIILDGSFGVVTFQNGKGTHSIYNFKSSMFLFYFILRTIQVNFCPKCPLLLLFHR